MASSLKLNVWSLDINQAYMRSLPIARLVFVIPDPASDMSPYLVFQVVHPLYGRADAGDACWRTVKNDRREVLNRAQCFSDPSLFFEENTENPSQIGTYVDDLVFASGGTLRAASHYEINTILLAIPISTFLCMVFVWRYNCPILQCEYNCH